MNVDDRRASRVIIVAPYLSQSGGGCLVGLRRVQRKGIQLQVNAGIGR